LLSASKTAPRIAERSLITSVSTAGRTAPLRPLLPPQPSERRIRRRAFVNDVLLGENSDHVILSDRRAAAELHPPLPPTSAEFDGTGENAVVGARFATRHRRVVDVDVDQDDPGADGKAIDVVDAELNRSGKRKRAGCPPVQTMLLVVTADMAAATAQIADDDRAESPSTTPAPCEISSFHDVDRVESATVAEPAGDVTSSTATDEPSTTVAAAAGHA